MQFCNCLTPVSFGRGLRQLADEGIEFCKKPSLDEMSDIAYAVGRLMAGVVGKVYVHMPLDERHITKIEKRMQEYGCIRSQRHLINGKCPSTT